RPEVEGLGCGSYAGSRRLPARPAVEQLEERRLMTSSGVISAVTDLSGQETVFAIGANAQVYEYSTTVAANGDRVNFSAVPHSWSPLVNYAPAGFRQVSAGLDGFGRAVCYALHNGDNHVWEMDNYHYNWYSFTTEGFDLGYTATQISATRNNECFAIHP